MNTIAGSVFILLTNVLFVLSFLCLIRRKWKPRQLKETNEVAGFYSAIIGTIYAVILAFMLASVWGDFASAEVNVTREANSLVDIYRLADGIPPPEGRQIRLLAHTYALITIERDWPAMAHEAVSPEAQQINDQLWQAIIHIQPHTSSEQVVMDHLLSKLTDLMEYRRMRYLQSQTKLPGILWAVLIVGGWITTGFACIFGVEKFSFHLMKSLALTLLVSLVLVAISELNGPFQGWLYVKPSGFVFALKTFMRLTPH